MAALRIAQAKAGGVVRPIEMLLSASIAASYRIDAEVLSASCDAMEKFDCGYLRLYLAHRYESESGEGRAANEVGRASENLGLRSLAYRAFVRAMNKGVSVGRVNAAGILNHGAAAAGIELLDGHSGAFDAASPHYPHEIRAQLESSVHAEVAAEQVARTGGERLYAMCSELVASCLECEAVDGPLTAKVVLETETANIPLTEKCYPFGALWYGRVGAGAAKRDVLVGKSATGEWRALAFDCDEASTAPRWVKVEVAP